MCVCVSLFECACACVRVRASLLMCAWVCARVSVFLLCMIIIPSVLALSVHNSPDRQNITPHRSGSELKSVAMTTKRSETSTLTPSEARGGGGASS